MTRRLLIWAVRSYVGGPAKSWLYTSAALAGLRVLRRIGGRRPVVEKLSLKKGQRIEVEHLSISHSRQIKELRRARRAERRAARQHSDGS